MILSPLPKYFSTRTLITLLLTLLISACNNDDFAETINDDISSYTPDSSDTTDQADINLSWTAPSESEDNKPISLSEIAGYKIYYGTARRKYSSSVNINDGTADAYTFRNFSAGTYYFALTTYDTSGRESKHSVEIKIEV